MELKSKKNIKYFYNNITLYMFCKGKNINYENVIKSIRYYQIKLKQTDIIILINKVVDKYLYLKQIKETRQIFILINSNEKFNISEICRKLSINRKKLYKLAKFGFSYKESINIIYFLSDNNYKNNVISIKTIDQIKKEIQQKEFSNSINYLVCYYYLGQDVQLQIYNLLEPLVVSSFNKALRTLGVSSFNKALRTLGVKFNKEDQKDFLQDQYMTILEALNNFDIVRSTEDEILKKFHAIFINKAFKRVKQIKQCQNEKHLEDIIYDNKTLLDFIPSYDYNTLC